MIVVDGRTDYDKLVELLAQPEGTHLDFKASVDLALPVDKLKFVKDTVAMSNRPPGGYLLIGVDDDGRPCQPIGTIRDRRRFDGAALDQLVRGYIEGETHILSKCHEHEGNEIVLVFIPHHRDRLPVPMAKLGQWHNPAKSKDEVVFNPGELIVREGSANVTLRHAHWTDLLSEYTKHVREEATTLATRVVRETFTQQNQTGAQAISAPVVALLIDMGDDVFVDAVVQLIENRNDVRVQHFLRTLIESIATGSIDQCEAALDKWALLAGQALHFERTDLAERAIEALHEAYKQTSDTEPHVSQRRLLTVVRLYALGSLIVRLRAWPVLRSLVLRTAAAPGYPDYLYSSWIRHGQVQASRNNLITDDAGAVLISAARQLLADHQGMRPDLVTVPPANQIGTDDALLNTLCQFDIAYCVLVATEGQHHGKYYPSSAALNEKRARPILDAITTQPKLRHELFPNSADPEIDAAIAEVYELAIRESLRYGGRWWGPPPTT